MLLSLLELGFSVDLLFELYNFIGCINHIDSSLPLFQS